MKWLFFHKKAESNKREPPKQHFSEPKKKAMELTELTKEEIDRICAELLKKAGKIPKRGTFTPVFEAFTYEGRELYIGDVKISIEPSILLEKRPMERIIMLTVDSPSGLSRISQEILSGQKQDIIAALENGIYDLLMEKIKKFSYDFIEGRSV